MSTTTAASEIYSTDYMSERVIWFDKWATYQNAYGAAESTIVYHYQTTVSSADVTRFTNVARENIRAYLAGRGDLGSRYRLNIAYQINFDTNCRALVFRAWEI